MCSQATYNFTIATAVAPYVFDDLTLLICVYQQTVIFIDSLDKSWTI